MSDEKQIDDFKLVNERGRKFPLTGISLLMLTVLLTCSVAALIYLSVGGQHSCQQLGDRAAEERIDLQANIKIESDDGSTVEEAITYNQVSKVAYYNDGDGSFVADDFGKGILLFRSSYDSVCYVTPLGSRNSTSVHNFETFMANDQGSVVKETEDFGNYEILPGEIEDLSIIPDGARSKCENGYQWTVPKAGNSGEISHGNHVRQKRSGRHGCCCHRHSCGCWHCHCTCGGGAGSPGRDGSPGDQ